MSARRTMFYAPAVYRLRRLRDTSRMLPVVGAFLFLLPILWSPAETEARDTAPDGIYLFVAWGLLVLAAALVSRGLIRPADGDGTGDEED